MSTPRSLGLGRPLGVSVGHLLVLLASLGGVFAMHGMSDHGTAGPIDMASAQRAHLSMSVVAEAPDMATAIDGSAAYRDSTPHPPMGGHDMGLGGLCLAVLVAVLMFSSGLWRRLRLGVLVGLPPSPARLAAVARARAPTPPDLFGLSIQRC